MRPSCRPTTAATSISCAAPTRPSICSHLADAFEFFVRLTFEQTRWGDQEKHRRKMRGETMTNVNRMLGAVAAVLAIEIRANAGAQGGGHYRLAYHQPKTSGHG